MDEIIIEDLKIGVQVGILERENILQQSLLFEIHLYKDFNTIDDSLKGTIDYTEVCQHLEKYLSKNKFKLIETVAKSVCEEILNKFPIKHVKVSVSKPHTMCKANNVKVVVERKRK